MIFSLRSAPERIVVAIYAFALMFPLLVVAIASFQKFLGPAVAQAVPYPFGMYAVFLPLSITYFSPLLFISLSQELRPSPISAPPMPEPLQFFIFLGVIVLLLFYPAVSYFLWYRYRVAWVLSFTASVSTLGLEIYAAATEGLILIVFWVFGVAANLLILYLLWRGKNSFFNRATDL